MGSPRDIQEMTGKKDNLKSWEIGNRRFEIETGRWKDVIMAAETHGEYVILYEVGILTRASRRRKII